MRLTLRSLLLTLLFIVSCNPPAQKAPASTKGASSKASNLNSQDSNAIETRTSLKDTSSRSDSPAPTPVSKVDATKLTIMNLTIGKLAMGGTRSEVVSFSASGQTQYVLWQLCPEEASAGTSTCVATDSQACGLGGACVQNVTPYNKILFPRLFAGKVTFSIKACVDPSSALDPNQPCGAFTDLEYDSHVSNTEVTSLFAKRQGIIDALNTLGEQIRKIYVNYEGDLKQCMEHDQKNAAFYQSKIAAVHGLIDGVFWRLFTWGPKALIEEMEKSSVGQGILNAAKSVAGGIKHSIGKATDAFCAIGETTGIDTTCMSYLKDSASTMTQTQQEALCQNAKADKGAAGKFCGIVSMVGHALGGLAAAMNPAESIAILSDAIHNVIDPGASVSITCHAEQNMAKTLQAANENAAVLTQQLIEVDNKLRDLGEL